MRSRHAGALLVLKFAVSGGLLGLLLARIGIGPLIEVMGRAAAKGLLAAALLLLVSQALACWQWGRLLAVVGVLLPVRRIVGYYFAGTFLNLVLPGAIGGDLARVMGAGQESGRGTGVVGATVVERLLGGAALGVLAIAALMGAGAGVREAQGGLLAAVVIGYALVSLVALVLVLGPGARWLLRTAGSRLPAAIGVRLGHVGDALAALGAATRGSFFATAIAIQSARILAHAQVARAMDMEIELRYFFLFVPLLAVAVALPVSIGGIGVRETLGAVLFGLLGLEAAEASAMQLLGYFLAAAVSLPGAILLLALRARPRLEASGTSP